MTKYWLFILIAGLLEIIWATGLKYSDNTWQWGGTAVCIFFSFYFIIQATKKIPVATAYAIFTGLGAVGTVLIDIFIFDAQTSAMKILLLCTLIAGILGLKLVTPESEEHA